MTDHREEDLKAINEFWCAAKIDGGNAFPWASVQCGFHRSTLNGRELEAKLQEFDSASGWRCWTDRIESSFGGGWPEKSAGTRDLLTAELRVDERRSIAARHVFGDTWEWIEAVEGDGEGADSYLVRTQSFLSVHKDGPDLQYRVYWKLDDGRYRPVASRFLGFNSKANANAHKEP
jgi:hypothetical protein